MVLSSLSGRFGVRIVGGRVIEAWNAALVMFKAAAGLGRPEGGLEQREQLPIPGEGEGLMRLFRDNPYVRVTQSLQRIHHPLG